MKKTFSKIWYTYYNLVCYIAVASVFGFLATTIVVLVTSPFVSDAIETRLKFAWLIATATSLSIPYFLLTDKVHDFLLDRQWIRPKRKRTIHNSDSEAITNTTYPVSYDDWEQSEEDSPRKVTDPNAEMIMKCKTCVHYNGQTYNGNFFICAMHPYGELDCPDHEGTVASILEISSTTTPFLEEISELLEPANKVLSAVDAQRQYHPQSLKVFQWVQGAKYLKKAIEYFNMANDRNP